MNGAQVGIRLNLSGAAQVEGGLNRVGDRLDSLGASTRTAQTGAAEMASRLDGVNRSALASAAGADRLSDAVARLGHYGLGGVGLAALVATAHGAAKAFFDASASAQRLSTQLEFATGNSARHELSFAAALANRLGLELNSVTQAYAGFASAARGTALEGQRARDTFEAIAKASAVMGLSAHETQGALLAVQQMMGKGVVSAEEFRGQLGERMPIALQAGAHALGVTTAEFTRLMETGQLIAVDFLPKFADAINTMLGDSAEKAADRLDASVARMSNAWQKFKQTVGDAGVAQAVAREATAVSGALDAVSDAMLTAKASGAGFAMQLSAGVGNALGRLSFDAVSGAANLFNGTLNALSLGALNLKTDIDLLPDAFRTNAEQVALMGAKMQQAQAAYAALQSQLEQKPDNIYIKSELASLGRYIASLREAIALRASLSGQDAGLIIGSVPNPDRLLAQANAQADAQALAALREQGQAYAKLVTQLATPQEKLNAALMEAQNALGALYTPEIEARIKAHYIKPTQQARAATVQSSAAQREQAEHAQWLLSMEQAADEHRQKMFARRMDEHDKLLQAAQDAAAAHVAQHAAAAQSAQQRLQDMEHEAEAMAYAEAYQVSMAQAVERTTIARLKEKQVQAMGNEAVVLELQREIEARQRIADMMAGRELRAAAQKLREDEEAAWARTWEQVGQSFTDALMRGGRGVAQYLKDLFRTLVLRPVLAPVGSAVASMFGASPAAAAVQGGGGALGMLLNLPSSGPAIMQGIAGPLQSGFAGVGATVGSVGASVQYGTAAFSQQSTMLAAQEAGMGTLSGTLGSAASAMGGALVGFMAGRIISGGYSAIGASGNAAVAVGTGIGLAVGGPIGAAIGGAIGGLVNRAFGRKLKDSGIQGEFGGAQGFEGQGYEFYKGGWFRSDKTKTRPLDEGVQSALAGQYAALKTASAGMAQTLGLNASALDAYTRSIKLSTKGLSEAQVNERLAVEFAAMGDEMAALLLGTVTTRTREVQREVDEVGAYLGEGDWERTTRTVTEVITEQTTAQSEYARAGETASQTLQRLAASLGAMNPLFEFMGATLFEVSLRGADAASALADALGGLDAASAKIAAYHANFYTEAERTEHTTRALTRTLGELGYALPETRAGFRALVEAQDLTTEGGRAAYAALMNVQDAFASITPSAADLAAQLNTVGAALGRLFEDLRGQIGRMRSDVASARESITGEQNGPLSLADIRASIAAIDVGAGPSRSALDAALGRQIDLERAQQAQAAAGGGVAQTAAQTAAAQTELGAAQQAVEDAQRKYVQGIAAWVAASKLSTEALGKLKAETLRYHAQQQDLAQTMRQSAASLRAAVDATRQQTMTEAQDLASRMRLFARNYLMAQFTTGSTKAAYADKLAAALPQLSADLAATSASRLEWAEAVARLSAQAKQVADRVDATAPATYEAESLALLDAIEGKLAGLDATALGLQDSVTAAIHAGAARTAAGLSNLIKVVQEADKSASLQAFATGGVFTNSVVNSPTVAPMALFGEAGPEAIMPLARGPGGVLGVHAHGGGQPPQRQSAPAEADPNAQEAAQQREMLAEIKRLGERLDALNKEVRQLRQENNIGNGKIADSTDRSARLHERWATVGLPATEGAHA